jgi:hypothetical protein
MLQSNLYNTEGAKAQQDQNKKNEVAAKKAEEAEKRVLKLQNQAADKKQKIR